MMLKPLPYTRPPGFDFAKMHGLVGKLNSKTVQYRGKTYRPRTVLIVLVEGSRNSRTGKWKGLIEFDHRPCTFDLTVLEGFAGDGVGMNLRTLSAYESCDFKRELAARGISLPK